MPTPTPIMRNSERTAMLRCPARWWWSYREGLVPRSQQLGPLWFGEGIHLALALWYCGPGMRRGPEPAETWRSFVGEAIGVVKTASATEERVAQYEDAAALGVTMLEGYRALYGLDEHMDIIKAECSFSMDVPWPKGQALYLVKKSSTMANFSGTWDLAYRDLRSGRPKLEEHKTAKAISTRHLALDNQGGSYWAVATRNLRSMGLIGPKETLEGVEYNFLRKSVPDDRPRDAEGYACNKPTKEDYRAAIAAKLAPADALISPKATLAQLQEMAEKHGITVLGERSKVQPAAPFERHMIHRTRPEQAAQLRRVQTDAYIARVLADRKLPITKNPTFNCSWDCDFYDMCQLQERGGNWEEYRDLVYVIRDPYVNYRKSAEE